MREEETERIFSYKEERVRGYIRWFHSSDKKKKR